MMNIENIVVLIICVIPIVLPCFRVDIDAELKKLDEDSNEPKPEVKNVVRNPNKPNIPQSINATGLTDDDKKYKAEKEKEKGNEVYIFCLYGSF